MMLEWPEFKTVVDQRALSVQCVTLPENLWLSAFDGYFSVECMIPNVVGNSYYDEYQADYAALANQSPKTDVITLFEKSDKIPRYASVSGTYDLNGDCTLMIKVPGSFDPTSPTRYMSLAYFVSDVFFWGDKVTSIEITDEDNIIGLGAGVVLDSLHDVDADAANGGWFFYPTEGTAGELEVTPSDRFGEINGQLYIKAKLKRAAGSTATKVFVNIDWGAKRP